MKIDKTVHIIESAKTNERRRRERAQAGLNQDFTLADNRTVYEDYMAGDPKYYQHVLGNKQFNWEEL